MKTINIRNQKSTVKYINDLFEDHSKIQVLRVDLGYKKDELNTLTVKEAKKDLSRLLANRRSNPGIFENFIGHIWKMENAPKKGHHFHTAFLYNGSEILNDAHWSKKIGEYWQQKITDGRGIYFNCNANKAAYERNGIGMIIHSDTEKRDNLINAVVPYLTKVDQSINEVKNGNERSFGKGVYVKRQKKIGRPRG